MKIHHVARSAALAFALTLSLLACEDKTPAPPSTPDAAGASAENATIPVPENYEAEAEEAVTPDNVETELTKLESEVDSEAGP